MSKYTPWFPRFTKPVRVGLYKRRAPYGIVFALWDGYRWRVGNADKRVAVMEVVISAHQPINFGRDVQWRGLKEPA